LKVNIDGPYGLPPPFSRYSHILLIGGGIGITPLHSSLRSLYLSARDHYATTSRNKNTNTDTCSNSDVKGNGKGNGHSSYGSSATATATASQEDDSSSPTAYPYAGTTSVRLVWVVRSKEAAHMFRDTVSD
jgi:hypothetical protein